MTRSTLAARLFTALAALAGTLAAQTTTPRPDPFTITAPLASNAISSCGDLTLSGQVVVDSAGLTTTVGSNSGNVLSNGYVKVSGQAIVNGSATAGPGKSVQVNGKANVTGTSTVASSTYDCTPIDLTQLTTTLKATNDDAKIPHTAKGKAALTNNTDFAIDGQDSITLPAGTYFFTSFKVTGGSVVLTNGPVRILCTGAVAINGGSALNFDAAATTHNPFLLHLWSSGTSLSISNAKVEGFVYAPSATTTISESTLAGSLFANAVTVSGNAHVTRIIDDVPPKVTITAPTNNQIFSDGSKIVVTGTASDDQTGIALKVNGTAVVVNTDGTWTTTLNLSSAPSPVTITALVTDAGGNTATAKVTIQIIPPPVVTLVSPADGSIVATHIVNLTGSAGTAATVTVNGQPATITNGTWTLANFDLGADGTHTLTIIGTNPGGSTTITAKITSDTTAPTLQYTLSPQPNGAGWNKSDVTVTPTCSDGGTGIASCTQPFTVTKEGAGQQFPIAAVDKAGNKTTLTVTINLDKTAPVLTFTAPADKTITKSDHIAVAGTADDSISALVNGVAATVDTTAKTFSVASLPLAEKANTITVTGTDIAGNSGTATITVTRDDLPPHIAITSPANNAIVNTNLTSVTVTGSASDDETSVATVTVNGQPATLSNGSWTATLDLSSATSPATITAVATDAAGNTANASVSIITLPPPVLTLVSPKPGSFVTRTVTLSGSAGTATSVTVNGQAATLSSGTWTLANLDLGADGAHALTITGTNAGGSTTITPAPTLIVDTTPPTIKASASPAPNAAGWNNKDVTVTFTCDDGNGSGIASCGPNVTVTQEGANQTITGTAKDNVGNTATASITLNIDKTAPAMTITNYNDGQIVNTAQVKITGGSDDAISASVNGVSATIDATAKTYTVPSLTLTEGTNTVTASGTDVAGNTGTKSITITLDDVAPKIAITSPANNATVGNPTAVVINGTATDAQTSVASVQVNGHAATVDAQGNWSVTLDLSKETSPVTITATATDAATNSASATISVVTVPPPVLTLTLPAPDSFVKTRIASLSGGAGTADTVTVNGQPATVSNGGWSITNFDLGADGPVTLTIVGTNIGGSTTITPHLVLDTVAPTIQIASVTPAANAAGWNNSNVTVKFTCADAGSGIASCGPDVTVATEGAALPVVGTAVDNAGNQSTVSLTLNIDKTAPHFTFTTPAANAILGTAKVTVTGGADDAIAATVNGVAAVIDPVAKTFTATVTLAEGSNTITVSGSDIAGNSSSASLPVVVDTQAPQVTITSPAANACTNATSLDIKGTVSDANLKNVTVQLGANTVTATVTNGAWVASFSDLPEGKNLFTIQAVDAAGHTSTLSLTVNADRTKPAIAFTESGTPFTATLFNRAVSPFVRVTDADPSPALTVTLDGAPYTQGTSITAEGQHTLSATATDCAGNSQTQTAQFTIDRTPPSLSNFNPANAGTSGSVPTTLTGTSSETATVSIAGTGITATTDSSNNFSLSGVPFSNGTNKFTLHAVDAAGNASDTPYTLTVRSNAPIVTITDNGTAIADGTLFNHAVTPVITADSPDDTISATLNGNAFTAGTAITADGVYTLVGTAKDPVGHSTDKSVKFTIDTTAPVVKITSPADGSSVDADTAVVTGSAGDAASVSVNGVGATITNGVFTANVPLDPGSNLIVAVGVDAAGNRGRDQVTVNRGGSATGVLLTYPPDGFVTNRNTTVITGRVLTPAAVKTLTLEGHVASGQSTGTITVTPDPSGSFTVTNFSLFEGIDTITATTATATGKTASAIVHVTVDLTPPVLQVLAGGVALDQGVHFPGTVSITATATDAPIAGVTPVAPTVALQIDGASVTQPASVSAAGGHNVVATATDAAGNQARVERTFFIGVDQAAGCSLDGFDPANGAVVTANSTTLVGRTGGAAGVKINNIPAQVANGMFTGTVELSVEGANNVSIVCTDAAGNPTGTPQTIVLNRVTAAPSVTIDSPAEMAYVNVDPTTQTFTVSGSVQNATTVDVNGAAATISNGTYTASVRPIAGLNILVAHAKNAAGALSIASRRVVYLQNAPSLSITWPTDGFTTGASTIDVSGTYTNLDPTTIQSSIASTKIDTNAWSDTTGSFVVHGLAIGTSATPITITGHDALNHSASATINVTQIANAPSIAIAAPANNSYLPAGTTIPVSGSYTAASGAQVDVNGAAATTDNTTTPPTYKGSAPFGAIGPTAITAHVLQPDGNAAIATAIVNQLSNAPTVKGVFPADGATAVDPGVMPLVSFSAPMDAISLKSAFSLLDPTNTVVTGQFRLDKDVLSFAAATTLKPGATYTIDIKTTAKDLAGNALAAEFTSKFTIATTAPFTPPAINPISGAICASSVQISGTAPAGARVEIDLSGVPTTVTADATGNYTATITIPQTSAYLVARARIVGEDGSYSPSASAGFQVDCSGPQVLGAVYDRTANAMTVTFSKAVDLTTVSVGAAGSVQVALSDGTQLTGSVAAGSSASSIVITPAAVSPDLDPRTSTVSLTVTTAVKDTTGRNLGSQYSQTFTYSGSQPATNDGQGYINGQVLDASNGRPLAGAAVSIDVPINALKAPKTGTMSTRKPLLAKTTAATATTDATGHYTPRLAEGPYAIHVSGSGYTDVYRQVVVSAGQGVIPIDIRLTRRGNSATVATGDLTVTNGGDDSITPAMTLTIPSGSAATGTVATLTAVGGQGLPGLLPLGWSPLAAAEVHVVTPAATPLGSATSIVTFQLPASVASSGRSISAVGYDASVDQWNVLQPVVSIGSDGSAKVNLALPATITDASGANSGTTAIALVYPDAAPFVAPPQPVAGGVLTGVADPCAGGACPSFTAKSFVLNPNVVMPTQRTVATLVIDGSGTTPPQFVSGSAIEALVNEELRLIDGSVLNDVPFSTDLILYRSLDGQSATADFHLAPSPLASQKPLQIGFDHIQIIPYPGRIDRGTLIGPAGGRVPSDEQVQVNIPAGATADSLHATAKTITDFSPFGSIDGFQIVGGFTLTLDPTTTTAQPYATTQLIKSANATFTVDPAVVGAAPQLVLVEVLQTNFGRMFRLADPMAAPQPIASSNLLHVSTAPINPATLPVDGIIRPGQFLLLLAKQPIAFATGNVSQANGPVIPGAAVATSLLGVRDLTRTTGIYAIPVVAAPAAPFTLVPTHPTLGDGVAYTATSAPAANAVVPVNLTFAIQPPVIQTVTVTGPQGGVDLVANNGATGISLSTGVQVAFNQSIDPSSVTASSITVTNTNGQPVTGTTTANGTSLTWTMPAGASLAVNSTYSVQVNGAIKGSHGAPLGSTHVYTFSSVTQLTSSQINASKIRITIPDANGISTIIGDPGALPTVPPEPQPWRAIALRRGNAFVTQYQVTANNDGSFSFPIGTCGGSGNCIDSITIKDHIDLEILNAAGNIAAVLPLTPFVTADGSGFVAPTDQTTTFTSKDGVTVTVPAGSFDQPTIVSVAKINDDSPYTGIPTFHQDMNLYGAVNLNFDCSAGTSTDPTSATAPCESHKRIDVSMPATVDPTGKIFLLGWLGQSVRGPKIMIVDTVTDVNGVLTTASQTTSQGALRTVASSKTLTPGVHTVLTGSDVKNFLCGVIRSGIYNYIDLHVDTGSGFGWMATDTIQSNYDLFWDSWASLYASHLYLTESHGRIIVPVMTNKPIQMVGYDAGTGIQAFTKVYDPLPISDPGTAYIVNSPFAEPQGPYPVYSSPGRVEMIDLLAESVAITRPGLSVTLTNGQATVTDDGSIPDDVDVWVLNVSSGHQPNVALRSGHTATVAASVGDRIVILVGEHDVDPAAALSVVFSKAIDSGSSTNADDINTYIHQHNFFTVGYTPDGAPAGTGLTDITPQVRFGVDSSGRRVTIDPGPMMQRGALYQVAIQPALSGATPAGGAPALQIGQVRDSNGTVTGTLVQPMYLKFKIRSVPNVAQFSLNSGSIRDYAMNGNVLFIAGLDGGLFAYDASDPAALNDTTTSRPMPVGEVDPNIHQSFWAVASDRHGRVYSTAVGNTFGFINSYRVEDFTGADGAPVSQPRVVPVRSGGIVSWAPGYSASLDINTVLSDRPEGIPRKLQLAEEDTTIDLGTLQQMITTPPAGLTVVNQTTTDGIVQLTLHVKKEALTNPNFPYVSQRITIENVTRNMRWSTDAYDNDDPNVTKNIAYVVGDPNDKFNLIYNERTYGVVTIFGYGIGVFDLNAIESNDDTTHQAAGYTAISERVKLTQANVDQYCDPLTDPEAIPDLSLSPDVTLIPGKYAQDPMRAYGLDVHLGVLDEVIQPPITAAVTQTTSSGSTAPNTCDDRAPRGLILGPANKPLGTINPALSTRIAALVQAFQSAQSRPPTIRLNGIQSYHWHLAGANNPALPAATTGGPVFGQRHSSPPNADVDRDYLLVPSYDLGIIVVDATYPANYHLDTSNIADVIWVPSGVVGVRVIPETNDAVAVDTAGRVLLIDLSNVDQRFDGHGTPIPPDAVFPKTLAALNGVSTWNGAGAADPRIIWASQPGVVNSSMPPIIDPDTGMMYAGTTGTQLTQVKAIFDPQIQLLADTGTGGLNAIGGVVPLGVDPPAHTLGTTTSTGSLAAFRVQITLPGGVAEHLPGNALTFAIESERVPGAVVEQTPVINSGSPFPRSSLRQVRPDGTAEPVRAVALHFSRFAPASISNALRRQKGFNSFLSPWILAIADPRASASYVWTAGADKRAAGCYTCDRPTTLAPLTESTGLFEIWSGGRDFVIHPELIAGSSPLRTVFDSTPYSYLSQGNRLVKRFPTIVADTTRSLDVVSPGLNPPSASGAVQETVLLHSGELQTSNVDLTPGGRAGWNVSIDRNYRSRTMLPGPFGLGWTSSLFRHLRALPSGAIEYHDETGEVFLYQPPTNANDPYVAPKGLLLRLVRTDDGWQMIDMKRRVTTFDTYGRLTTETDEFGNAGVSATNGNTIRYLYDLTGRLTKVIDPINRETDIAYWDAPSFNGWKQGRVKSVKDWRGREVDYEYDDDSYGGGHLTQVQLADVTAVDAAGNTHRPTILYTPASAASQSYNDIVELYPEIKAISDPSFNDGNVPLTSRVTFSYDTSTGQDRGKLKLETLATPTNDTVKFDYGSSPTVTDALGHVRQYQLTMGRPSDFTVDRAHISTITDQAPVAPWGFGHLGTTVTPMMATGSFAAVARTFRYGYVDGQMVTASLDGAYQTKYGYSPVDSSAPGTVLTSVDTTPDGSFSADPNAPAGGEAVHITYNPQSSGPSGTTPDGLYLQSMKANNIGGSALTVNVGEPHRQMTSTNPTNDQVTTQQQYYPNGLLHSDQSNGGTDGSSSSATTTIDYYQDPTDKFSCGRQQKVTRGTTAPVITTYTYVQNGAGITVTEHDQSRGINTVTQLDAWDRPTDVKTSGSTELTVHQMYTYYATGQLQSVKSERTNADGSTSTDTTTYAYDALGRVTDVQQTNAAVEGAAATLDTATTYPDLKTTVKRLPTGHNVTTTTDDLGRSILTTTETGPSSTPILHAFGYDVAGNLVYQSDNFVATEMAYDAAGREVAVLRQDGTRRTTDHDGFGNVHNVAEFAADGTPVGNSTATLTGTGRVSNVQTNVGGAAGTRTTQYAWNGAGITTNVATSGTPASSAPPTTGNSRASLSVFDDAGRIKSVMEGSGTTGQPPANPYSTSTVSGYSGSLPTQTTIAERGQSYAQTAAYNTNGDAISTTFGSLNWAQHFDQQGNVTRQQNPAKPEAKYAYDSRGALTTETLPNNTSINHQSSALGLPTQYKDQEQEPTTVSDKDWIGRPLTRTYKDGTSEAYVWEGTRLKSYTNRQGQTLTYSYDPNTGKLFQITNGTTVLDELHYDTAGRVSVMKTPDAEIDVDQYDNEGHPLHVKETRIVDGTPSFPLEQTYTWNAHGERTSWTMPRVGTPGSGWTDTVFEDHDEAGNVIGINRTQFGGSSQAQLLGATYRNAGRPDQRTVTTSCVGVHTCTGGTITRQYGYNTNGQMNSVIVNSSGGAIAGAVANYEANGLQIHDVQILGLSAGSRYTTYGYDDRGRLRGAVMNTTGSSVAPGGSAPGTVGLNYGDADFLGGASRVSRLDSATRTTLTNQGVDVNKIDPPGTTATQTNGGHKIDQFGPVGTTPRNFVYNGSLVADDGNFIYKWNEKEQLVSVTQRATSNATPIRRIRYYYDSRGRVIGRRAQTATAATTTTDPDTLNWQTETNASILAADGMPADTTFAWDMVSDQLIAVFNTNASPTDPNGGLIRQIIHGGLTYDDPIEVTMASGDANGGVNRLYPVFDEAGSGSLQAVLNVDAQLVARNLPDDPTGGDDVTFAGATVDHATVAATKDSTGNLQSVVVTLHATEPLDATTLATGMRLASVAADGTAVKTFPGSAQLVSGDAYSARFTVPAADWTTLNDPSATSLSIGITPTLRAQGWDGGLPILPPTDWAKANGVYTSPTFPVELRDSLATLSTFISNVPSGGTSSSTIYDVPSIALVGSASSGADATAALFTAKFQALPFSDPATHLVYARARWYDPETGQFLSTDPLGYRDSSNLYAFAAGDPVNARDPSGRQQAEDDPKDVADSGVDMFYDARKKEAEARKTARQIGRAGYQALDLATDFAPGIGVLKIPLPFIEAYQRGGRQELMRMGLNAGMVVMISAVLTHRLHPEIKLTKEELALEENAEFKLSLESEELEKVSKNYKKTFFEAHPELEGKVVVHHAIEQQAIRRYPDVIAEQQIHRYENLRGIPKEINADVHLSKIRKAWNQFYKKHPKATLEELKQQAAAIDREFGHLFNPPVKPQ